MSIYSSNINAIATACKQIWIILINDTHKCIIKNFDLILIYTKL
jgi:hypothetical protein